MSSNIRRRRHSLLLTARKMAKRMKFSVIGLPHYTIWHLYEPSVDDIKHMEEMEKEKKKKEATDAMKEEAARRIQDEFGNPSDQWQNDQSAIKQKEEEARKEREAKEKEYVELAAKKEKEVKENKDVDE